MFRKLVILSALAVSLAGAAFAEKITVKTLSGKEIAVDIALSQSVESLKQIVVDREGVPADQQRLIFAGKQLENGASLASYGITEGATVFLVLRLRGN